MRALLVANLTASDKLISRACPGLIKLAYGRWAHHRRRSHPTYSCLLVEEELVFVNAVGRKVFVLALRWAQFSKPQSAVILLPRQR